MERQLKELSEDWKDIKEVAVFGFGKNVGQGNVELFIKYFKVVCIIDNDEKKNGEIYNGIPIIKLSEFMKKNSKFKIVVLMQSRNKQMYDSASLQLRKYGLVENKDFCSFATFSRDWFWNLNRISCIGKMNISVSTFCTMNCIHCSLMTAYNKNKRSWELESLCNDADIFFEVVDYVYIYSIIGGEPLLYKQLPDYIEYVGEKYRDKISNLQIITNGTLVPDEKMLKCLKKYDVEVRISDYNLSDKYHDKLNQLYKVLAENGIKFITYRMEKWFNYGFPQEKIELGNTDYEIKEHMMRCNPYCHNLCEGKIYFCISGWAAEQAGLFKLKETDYIDLKQDICVEEKRKAFRKLYYGDFENGYMSFCKVCRGLDKELEVFIPVAIQMNDTQEISEGY